MNSQLKKNTAIGPTAQLSKHSHATLSQKQRQLAPLQHDSQQKNTKSKQNKLQNNCQPPSQSNDRVPAKRPTQHQQPAIDKVRSQHIKKIIRLETNHEILSHCSHCDPLKEPIKFARSPPRIPHKQKDRKRPKKTQKHSRILACNQPIAECPPRAAAQSKITHQTFQEKREADLTAFQLSLRDVELKASLKAMEDLEKAEKVYQNLLDYACYLTNRQPELSWAKRAVLVDWIFKLAADFALKREVCACCVSLIDRYLASTKNISIDCFQLLGVSCLQLAAQTLDKGMTTVALSQAAGGRYRCEEIIQMEKEVLLALQFQILAPTPYEWALLLCSQWDLFLDSNQPSKFVLKDAWMSKPNEKSYTNFRSLCQYLDLALFEVTSLLHKTRTIAISFLYLTLLICTGMESASEISTLYSQHASSLHRQRDFCFYFSEFLFKVFQQSIEDLLATLQFCATFFRLPLTFEPPIIDTATNLEFSQYCSIQTVNAYSLETIKLRDRSAV